MAEQDMNIYQKLAKIRKQVEVIQRNKSGYGYKYVSEDEILAKMVLVSPVDGVVDCAVCFVDYGVAIDLCDLAIVTDDAVVASNRGRAGGDIIAVAG